MTTLAASEIGGRPAPRVEHVVLGVAATALAFLVVLPLASLLWGSVSTDGRPTLDHFREALGSRLYVQALGNSLVLGAWTAALSVAIGLPLAWAVSRTNTPAKRFIHLTALVSYITPPFLTAIAFVNLFSPNAGLVNRFLRDVAGLPALTFNVFSMSGLVLVTVFHTFPFVYLLAASALESVDASMEESGRILGAGRWRTAWAITLPLVAPAVLSGALIAFVNAIALFGSQAIIGLPGRVFTLPTRIYALFDYPPQYGLASAMSLVFVAITAAALYLQRRFLARRSYVTLGGKGNRPRLVDLGPARHAVLAFAVGVFVVAVLAPYLTLLAVSLSRSWGLQFWQNLTLQHYRFVLLDPSYTAIQLMIVGTLSRKYGWEFYQKLRANDIMIVQGHQQVSETLTRGERLLAAEGADQYAWVDRKAGHKVQTIFPADGAFAIPAPMAVITGSPHPNAARALAEFMIGDAVQKLFPGEGIYAARADIEPPPGNPPLGRIKLIPVDYDHIEKEAAALKKRFNEIYQ